MKSSDTSNLNSLRSALQLYRADQGGYPPGLLGYVTPYQSGTVVMANVVPANLLRGALYPKRINAISGFKPARDTYLNQDWTHAVWPTQDARPVGSAPILDLNGDGKVDGTDDLAGSRQLFGPTDGYVMV